MQSSATSKNAALTWEWKGKKYSIPFSEKDLLQLARAVEYEGYPEEGVAWALIQRTAWLNTHGVPISLGKLIEQYVQPINPRWFAPKGDLFVAEIERLKRLGDQKGVEIETANGYARAGRANETFKDISPKTAKVVLDILRGQVVSPVPGAVHYWASRGPDFKTNQDKKPGMVLLDRGYGFGKGRNVFFAAKGGETFSGVKISNPLNTAFGRGLPGVIGMLVAAGVAYFGWKVMS